MKVNGLELVSTVDESHLLAISVNNRIISCVHAGCVRQSFRRSGMSNFSLKPFV